MACKPSSRATRSSARRRSGESPFREACARQLERPLERAQHRCRDLLVASRRRRPSLRQPPGETDAERRQGCGRGEQDDGERPGRPPVGDRGQRRLVCSPATLGERLAAHPCRHLEARPVDERARRARGRPEAVDDVPERELECPALAVGAQLLARSAAASGKLKRAVSRRRSAPPGWTGGLVRLEPGATRTASRFTTEASATATTSATTGSPKACRRLHRSRHDRHRPPRRCATATWRRARAEDERDAQRYHRRGGHPAPPERGVPTSPCARTRDPRTTRGTTRVRDHDRSRTAARLDAEVEEAADQLLVPCFAGTSALVGLTRAQPHQADAAVGARERHQDPVDGGKLCSQIGS